MGALGAVLLCLACSCGDARTSSSLPRPQVPELTDFVALVRAGAADTAAVRVDGSTDRPALLLPYRRDVDFFVALAPGSVISVAEIAATTRAAARHAGGLTIEVEFEDGSRLPAHHLPVARKPQTYALAVAQSAIARIRFRAESGTGAAQGALRVVAPIMRNAVPDGAIGGALRRGSGHRGRSNIIIYSIDTLRADHLGAYGYEKPTSPNIDGFAREAVVFTNARANAPWTRPAVASIMTGLYPRAHGANRRRDALPGHVVTLAEVLRGAGYETVGWNTNGNLDAKFGFDQGFQRYRSFGLIQNLGRDQYAEDLHREPLEWLRERRKKEPFFLYLHAADPHGPYIPKPEFRARFAPQIRNPHTGSLSQLVYLNDRADGAAARPLMGEKTARIADELIALYDAEIAYIDHQIGLLFSSLRELGEYENTLIVLISDHGEEFFDHRAWIHGRTLYGEQLNIALLIKFPGGWSAGQRPRALAEQVDVVPTILDWIGVEEPDGVQGQSLLPLVSGGSSVSQGGPARATLNLDGRRSESVTVGEMKLIENYKGQPSWVRKSEIYDLRKDPAERHNLAAERPILTGYLRSLLATSQASGRSPKPKTVDVPPELRERLGALGYGE